MPRIPGMAVFRRIESSGRINHIGIYIGNDLVIEAKGVDHGVHVESFSQDTWHGYGMFD